jgi:ribosomal protein S18 acetylase RimI-like enzyme
MSGQLDQTAQGTPTGGQNDVADREGCDDRAPQCIVRRMGDAPAEAEAVAQYHAEGIPTGVLAELGPKFLASLYGAIDRSPDGFVLVGVDEQQAEQPVLGFICGTTNVNRVMRGVLWRHGFALLRQMLRTLISPRRVRRVIESLLYPSKLPDTLPKAELLSIVIDQRARGTSLGQDLMDGLLREFAARGIQELKVMVRADFERANAYYRKHGFQLAASISSHGKPCNIYVRETASS